VPSAAGGLANLQPRRWTEFHALSNNGAISGRRMEGHMFLDIDGNKVFTLSFGKGPRTFLAHSGWVGNFEDWIAVLAPMSESWRTVIYDHRGTGETSVPVEKITDEALVDDVFSVMNALGIERCTLGGFSRGTATALRAVLREPQRFDGLVLMNGTGGVQRPDAPPRPRVPFAQWPGDTHQDKLNWFIERSTPEPDVAHIRRWGRNILSRAAPEAAERIMGMQPAAAVDWAKALPDLRLPTLLIHGEKDFLVEVETMQYLQSQIQGSKLVVMEGSGHIPAMARPMDVYAAIKDYFG
jgi:pimeloyl-ACP methyl ester carboxylesterase